MAYFAYSFLSWWAYDLLLPSGYCWTDWLVSIFNSFEYYLKTELVGHVHFSFGKQLKSIF